MYLQLHQLRLVYQSAIDLVASTTDINFLQLQSRERDGKFGSGKRFSSHLADGCRFVSACSSMFSL